MLRAVIIEDEERARNVLKYNLKTYCAAKVEVCGEASNVKQGVQLIHHYNPDLVFLDIEMPNYSGFELLEFFKDIQFEIIFVTAYSEYALRAFEVAAMDYLLKPINANRLQEAIEKVVTKKSIEADNNRLKILEGYLKNKRLEKVSIPYLGGYYSLNVQEIIAVKAERSYAYIFYNDEKLLVSKSLSKVEELLAEENYFMRIHRSYLVNTNFIESYEKGEGTITLKGGLKVTFAKDNIAEIEKRLKRL